MNNLNCTGSLQPHKSNGFPTTRQIARRLLDDAKAIFEALCEMQRRHEMRQRMLRLDDRMLDDIGLTRAKVETHAAKPFWRS